MTDRLNQKRNRNSPLKDANAVGSITPTNETPAAHPTAEAPPPAPSPLPRRTRGGLADG